MRVLRILLQIIFVLISLITIFLSRPLNGDYASTLVMLAIFVIIILILGPFWPSQENIDRWMKKWKFNLTTDDKQVAIYVANYLGSIFSFYHAWDTYVNPTNELWRHERTAFAVAGINGVIAFWIILGFACLAYGIATHSKK